MILTIGDIVYDTQNNEYEIIESIGEGGFGQVFKIISKNNSEIYALKILPIDYTNKENYESFKREINASKKISNDNVIKYLYYHDGNLHSTLPPYIIMEFAEQGTLKNFLNKQTNLLNNETILDLFYQLLKGQNAINEQVLHRDLKPENILIKGGLLKISDFGLSKNVMDSTKTITFKGFGSKYYAPPEVWKNEKYLIKSDMYSMGLIFYQIATLKYPYNIDPCDINGFKNAHLYQCVKNPNLINSNLTQQISQCIMKMLEKNPENRFKDWFELRSFLQTEKFKSSSTEIENATSLILSRLSVKDEKNRQLQIEVAKKEEEYQERILAVKYAFETQLKNKIDELCNQINTQYPSENKMEYIKTDKNEYLKNGKTINYELHLVTGSKIDFEIFIPKICSASLINFGKVLGFINVKNNIYSCNVLFCCKNNDFSKIELIYLKLNSLHNPSIDTYDKLVNFVHNTNGNMGNRRNYELYKFRFGIFADIISKHM